MIAAEEIKARLSMRQVAVQYGFVLDRANCIICPFHADTKPSLRIYAEPGKGFYCYSCNAGGSVIDFVMRLFHLNYKQALMRINADFGYSGIPTDHEGLTRIRRERETAKRVEAQRQAVMNELAAEHCRLHRAMIDGPEWSDGWCEALMKLPDISYRLEVLECP